MKVNRVEYLADKIIEILHSVCLSEGIDPDLIDRPAIERILKIALDNPHLTGDALRRRFMQ